jgi:hypothetical protein
MSNFGWFALKCISMVALIGFVCWMTTSATPLWALLLMPSYSSKSGEE